MPLTTTIDVDTENQFDWARIISTFEDDVLISTRTEFDDGSSRTDRFDADGDTISTQMSYTDGRTSYEEFANGQPTLSLLRFPDDGMHNDLRVIQTYFDDAGIIDRKITGYHDDRPTKFEYFSDGELNTRVLQDNGAGGAGVKPWELYQINYDVDTGLMTDRFINFDNGIRQHDVYENGVRASSQRTDIDDVKSWSRIETTFDADGGAATRQITYDDGRVQNDTFTAGEKVSSVVVDADDAKGWDAITTLFDAGQIANRRVDYDNGDVAVTLYDAGERSQVIRFDGDDSASWLLSVTDFAPDGASSTTRYEEAADIPPELLVYFPEITPPVTLTQYVLDFDDNMRLTNGSTVLENTFEVSVGKGQYDIQGMVMPTEYGGADADADLEAFNSWGATVGFRKVDGQDFDFASLSLANASRADTTYIPEDKWANTVTINGYNDDILVQSVEIDLTFAHETHDLNWQGIDHIEFVASGGGITNDHVENAGWFSMDDLVFLA